MVKIFGLVILRAHEFADRFEKYKRNRTITDDILVDARKEADEYLSRITSLRGGIDFLKKQNEELRLMLLRVGVDMTIDSEEGRMADFISKAIDKYSAYIKRDTIKLVLYPSRIQCIGEVWLDGEQIAVINKFYDITSSEIIIYDTYGDEVEGFKRGPVLQTISLDQRELVTFNGGT